MKLFKNNKKEKLIDIYLYIDQANMEIYPDFDDEYALTFTCTPNPENNEDRIKYNMNPTNNLYYIISNGGIELTREQKEIIEAARIKYIGKTNKSRIQKEEKAKISQKELNELVAGLSKTLTRSQCELFALSANEDVLGL